jgi:hypothetical protein
MNIFTFASKNSGQVTQRKMTMKYCFELHLLNILRRSQQNKYVLTKKDVCKGRRCT